MALLPGVSAEVQTLVFVACFYPDLTAIAGLLLSRDHNVGQVLARELPAEYVLINGLKLPRGAGDIDHVVVGPTGVFLLKTKTMAGRIVCEPDGTWRRTKVGRAGTPYSAYIGDPAAQVQRNILTVRDCLRKRLPGLFRRTPLWIEGLVVFPHPGTELDAACSRIPAMRVEQTTARICLHVPRRALQPHEVDEVVDALLVEGRERHQPAIAGAQSTQALVEVDGASAARRPGVHVRNTRPGARHSGPNGGHRRSP